MKEAIRRLQKVENKEFTGQKTHGRRAEKRFFDDKGDAGPRKDGASGVKMKII